MSALELIESVKHKRVLFVGEYIQDVYCYVSPLGRPTKDAIVSVEMQSTEAFDGGVIAAAYHARDFCAAEWWSYGHICKTRFVEASHNRKLFEYYEWMDAVDFPLPKFGDHDAIIVLDYGHGMADAKFIDALSASKYLAVNVQTNAGNYGYNLATKYPYADYLCVDESEARLATQNRTGAIENSLEALSHRAAKVVITLGKAGAIGSEEGSGQIHRAPALTGLVVDTIGAGDAFFAITALVADRAPMAELLAIGNAAGALKAAIVGHRASISKHELTRLLTALPQQADAGVDQGAGQRRAV